MRLDLSRPKVVKRRSYGDIKRDELARAESAMRSQALRGRANSQITKRAALEYWATYVLFGRLPSAGPRRGGGGPIGQDEARQIAEHVERFFVPNCGSLRRVALEYYGRGVDPKSYQWRQPGESREQALLRLGWLLADDVPNGRMALVVLETFERHFDLWLDSNPVPVFLEDL